MPPVAFGSGVPRDIEALAATPIRSKPRPSLLGAPLTALQGIGTKLAATAAQIGIETVGDLLWHLPHGYRDPAPQKQIVDLRISETTTILVEVRNARVRPTRGRLRILEAVVADGSGTITAIWFNQAWLAEKLKPGTKVLLRGKLERRNFRVETHEIVGEGGAPSVLDTTDLVAVHPATERLRPRRIREWVWQALPTAAQTIEPLPAELRARLRLPGGADALKEAHFPHHRERAETARRRLAFEELFLHQAALATRRGRRIAERPGVPLDPPGAISARWLRSLPFDPTGDQLRAIEEIDADLVGDVPMQRLLMGEVGSGKTLVALHTMLRAVEAGGQAALMAPTETLAEQHAATLARLLAREHIPFALLTGATPARQRREYLGRLATGELGLVVGTHALIEPDVGFARLQVCVVDEQHRFGVRQRASLDAKGPGSAAPHVLHMTATPIPRTLSMTAYGDLDTTALRELPPGRQPVRTWVVGETKRAGAYEFVREKLREGRQAYVVCPLVSESAKLEAKAASDEAARLAASEFADFRVELLHGQMPTPDKASAMEAFASGGADVLVATSVIEVGVDVANASVMIVEGAERFGLSQLHQLRGRVGRGAHDSHCILFAEEGSELGAKRMEAIETERDGFKLAEVDLTLRGEGEILGTRQHGLPTFAAAILPDDFELLAAARREVQALLGRYGSLDVAELGPLIDAVRRRHGDERTEQLAA